jgi:hypothetical protein
MSKESDIKAIIGRREVWTYGVRHKCHDAHCHKIATGV